MSETYAAPDAGAGDNTPVTVITPAADTPERLSVRDAARVMANAREAKRKEAAAAAETAPAAPEQNSPAQAEEAAAPQEEVPGEVATETPEPAEVPPIEPPRSWTKEAKERWQSLPRETQEYLSAREQERDREVRRSQNEAAEQRKVFEADRQKAEQARQQYEAALPALMQLMQSQGQFADIKTLDDAKKLQAEDPFRFQAWQVHQMELQAVHAEQQKASERQEHERQTKWTEEVREFDRQFVESLSDADKAKYEDFKKEAPAFLEAKGFKQQELTEYASGKPLSIYHPAVQSLILDGLKYQAAQKAKVTKTATPVPQVQKPGTASTKGAAALQSIQALETRLEGASGVNAIRIAAQLAGAKRQATSR